MSKTKTVQSTSKTSAGTKVAMPVAPAEIIESFVGECTTWQLRSWIGKKVRGVVTFLHGFLGTDPATYGGWIAHLCDLGYLVVWIEYQKGRGSTYSPRAQTLILDVWHELLDTGVVSKDTPLILLGHSLGGMVVRNIATAVNANAVILADPGDADVLKPTLDSIAVLLDADSIQCPACVMWGEDDNIATEDKWSSASYAFEDSTTFVIPNANHYSPCSGDVRIGPLGNWGPPDNVDRAYWKYADELLKKVS